MREVVRVPFLICYVNGQSERLVAAPGNELVVHEVPKETPTASESTDQSAGINMRKGLRDAVRELRRPD